MILTIHQPSYWPWLGLLDKIAKADKYIILDSVDMKRQSYQFRNLFYCNGAAKYISIPVAFHQNTKINKAQYKNNIWVIEHLNKISNYYNKALFFNEIFPLIEAFYEKNKNLPPYLFVIETIYFMMKYLEIKTITELSSLQNYEGKKSDLMLDICIKNNASVYLSGQGAKEYMTETDFIKFKENNIEIKWQEFNHPTYLQKKNKPFISGLASLDILFSHGIEQAKNIFHNNIIL